MALSESGPAPYAPWTAVEHVINHARDKGLNYPLTTEKIARLGVEDSLSRRTLAALKQLDLVDAEGLESPTLERIRVAPSNGLQGVLAEWVQNAYQPIFAHVDASDDVEKIADQFRYYEPAGMRSRMVSLFLGLCAMAGLIEAMPIIPRGRGTKKIGKVTKPTTKAVATTAATPPKPSRRDETPLTQTARDRYADFLLERARSQEHPDPDLLDRIERALGIGGDTS